MSGPIIYDISTDEMRPITQSDVDKIQEVGETNSRRLAIIRRALTMTLGELRNSRLATDARSNGFEIVDSPRPVDRDHAMRDIRIACKDLAETKGLEEFDEAVKMLRRCLADWVPL